jgi:hypothetical protein
MDVQLVYLMSDYHHCLLTSASPENYFSCKHYLGNSLPRSDHHPASEKRGKISNFFFVAQNLPEKFILAFLFSLI